MRHFIRQKMKVFMCLTWRDYLEHDYTVTSCYHSLKTCTSEHGLRAPNLYLGGFLGLLNVPTLAFFFATT